MFKAQVLGRSAAEISREIPRKFLFFAFLMGEHEVCCPHLLKNANKSPF